MKDAVAAAYEQSLLYGEHTWGIDFKRFGKRVYGKEWEAEHAAGKYKVAEESWKEHGKYAEDAEGLAVSRLEENVRALAEAIKVEGPRIVVYNPLPWPRDCSVDVDVGALAPEGLADLETRKQVPFKKNAGLVAQVHLAFIARNVPAIGYRTYVPTGKAAPSREANDLVSDEKTNTIENAFFRVTLDPARWPRLHPR